MNKKESNDVSKDSPIAFYRCCRRLQQGYTYYVNIYSYAWRT